MVRKFDHFLFVVLQNNYTPLHIAVLGEKVEAVKLLTEHGADIHKPAKVSFYIFQFCDYHSYISMY